MKSNQAAIIIFLFFLFLTSINSFQLLKEEDNSESLFTPTFSLESGFYQTDEVEDLELSSNFTIYYTLDSTDPTTSETAKIYTKPIKMYDRSPEENVYSKCQSENKTNPYSIVIQNDYKANIYPFDKLTVIRAVAQNEDGEFSEVVTKSYLIMNSTKIDFYSNISVLSLVTNPENLFDKDKGIYVVGQRYVDWVNSPDYDPKKGGFNEDNDANFFMKGKEWEREATITLFKNGKFGFTQNVGIRVKGASTRNHKNKSFNIYARKAYGKSKIKFEILDDNKNFVTGKNINQYESFAIRGIDWIERMREKIVQYPLKELPELATYDTDRCLVFIDGEFWGQYDIMERCSGFYIHTNYEIPEDDIAIVKNGDVEAGPEEEKTKIKELNEFCKNNSLSDKENYKKVSSQIDEKSIIDHYAVGFYLGIWDWPDHNYLVWRNMGKKIEGNPYSDGKWRFGSFDFDFSAGLTYGNWGGVEGYQYDNFKKLIADKKEKGFPTAIFVAMLQNEEFRNKFIDTMYSLAENIFEKNKMSDYIDEIEEKYLDYTILGGWRWRTYTKNEDFNGYASWEGPSIIKAMKTMREFFNHRPEYIFDQMGNYLNKTEYKN